jgi:hypothetical protein
MKMAVSRAVTPRSLVEVHECFREPWWLHKQDNTMIALMKKASCTYETSVNIYKTKWRNIPEGSQLQQFLHNKFI